jgi:hypothetical protein
MTQGVKAPVRLERTYCPICDLWNYGRCSWAHPARGHIPFPGHRTVEQVRRDEEAAA